MNGKSKGEYIVLPVILQGDLARNALKEERNVAIIEGQLGMSIDELRSATEVVGVWASSVEYIGTVEEEGLF